MLPCEIKTVSFADIYRLQLGDTRGRFHSDFAASEDVNPRWGNPQGQGLAEDAVMFAALNKKVDNVRKFLAKCPRLSWEREER